MTQSAYIPDPISTPDAWDYIVLAGQISPGIAEVSDASIQYKWDEPDAKGSSGSDIVFNGRENAKVRVVLTLWEPAHFHTWELFRQLLILPEGKDSETTTATVTTTSTSFGPRFDQLPGQTQVVTVAKAKGQPEALDIQHPWCSMAGITSVVPDKIGQPERQADGGYKIELIFRQYAKPKPAGGKPSGSVANKGGGYPLAGAGGGAGPINPVTDPNSWPTVPNPDGNDYRRGEDTTAEGEAVQGEADALAQEPDA